MLILAYLVLTGNKVKDISPLAAVVGAIFIAWFSIAQIAKRMKDFLPKRWKVIVIFFLFLFIPPLGYVLLCTVKGEKFTQ